MTTKERYIDAILGLRKRPTLSDAVNNPAFLFFSDLHADTGDSSALSRIVAFANELGSGNVDAIINGGDTVRSYVTESTVLTQYANRLDSLDSGIDALTAIGNHDAWAGSGYKWITEAQVYNYWGTIITSYSNRYGSTDISQPQGKCYFYKDYGKVRVIVLNGGDYEHDNIHENIFWNTAQKTWLENALTSARTGGKHVLIVNHYPFDPLVAVPWGYSADETGNWGGGYNSISSYKKSTASYPWISAYATENEPGRNYLNDINIHSEALAAVKSFMDAGGNFIGWLCGHSHFDLFWWINEANQATYGKQALFTTGSAKADALSNGTYTTDLVRVAGEYSQDLYNYIAVDTKRKIMSILRIGANWDWYGRERNILVWDYENKEILRFN